MESARNGGRGGGGERGRGEKGGLDNPVSENGSFVELKRCWF